MTAATVRPGSLDRRLGLGDAVFIGLGSMIGAGVFAVYAPAAHAAGRGDHSPCVGEVHPSSSDDDPPRKQATTTTTSRPAAARRFPRWLQLLGAPAAWCWSPLPRQSVITGVLVFARPGAQRRFNGVGPP